MSAITALDRRSKVAATIIVATLAGVFILPWFVPVSIAQVVSDSQAVGFSNRTATICLIAGSIAMALLAYYFGRATMSEQSEPFVNMNGVPAEDRVNPRLVGAVTLLTLLMVLAVGAIVRDHPFGDALYFTNGWLRVAAGGKPFSQVEFSYGPAMFYVPFLTWRMLRVAGANMYAVYYCWVGIFHALGLLFTAYLLNRIQLRRSLRSAAFMFVGAFSCLQVTLGLNYTVFRFLLPYVLLVYVLGRLSESPRSIVGGLLPLAAVAIAASVSPEMGVALLVGLVAALVVLIVRGSRAHLFALSVLLIGSLLVAATSVVGLGTMAAFAGGAFYFPVLPGLPALVFVGTMLLLAWSVGSTFRIFDDTGVSLQTGWFALALVLVAPSLGRADFGHLLFNGLGAVLACVAIADRYRRRGSTYLGLTAAVFLSAMVLYIAVDFTPSLLNPAAGADQPQTAARLAEIPSLAFDSYLNGEVGRQLSESGNLVPTYCDPAGALTRADFAKVTQQLASARSIALPTSQLDALRRATAGSTGTESQGLTMSVPTAVGGPHRYGELMWFPIKLKGRNPIFDIEATYGKLLQRDWTAYEQIGQYTLLRRR